MDLKTLPTMFKAKKSGLGTGHWPPSSPLSTPGRWSLPSLHPPGRCVMVESCMSKHQPGHQPKGALARQPAASWFPGTAGAGATQTGPCMLVDGVRHQGPCNLSGLVAGPFLSPGHSVLVAWMSWLNQGRWWSQSEAPQREAVRTPPISVHTRSERTALPRLVPCAPVKAASALALSALWLCGSRHRGRFILFRTVPAWAHPGPLILLLLVGCQ